MKTIRMSAPARRAAIIDQAIRLFSEKGFRGVTTRELAQAVGVSEPILYQHFPSKRDLYDAILETIARTPAGDSGHDALPVSPAGKDDREFLAELADLLIRWHEQNPAYVRLFIFSALEGNELGEMFFNRHSGVFFDALASYFRRRMEAGAFRAVDPLLAAHHFIALIRHYGINSAVCPRSQHRVGREQVIPGIVDILLKGIQS